MKIFSKLLKYYLLMVLIPFIGRVGLFIWQYDRLKSSDNSIWLSFLYGLKMDTIVASMLLVIPLLILTFSPVRLKSLINNFLRLYFIVAISLIIYIEFATFPFFSQYDVRPNYKFVEYLNYPKEVIGMILADYKLPLFLAISAIVAFILLYLKKSKEGFLIVLQEPLKQRVIWFLPLALLLFIGIRSSFGHRPANISDAMYSNSRVLNEVTKNSLYSIGYAIYSNKNSSAKVAKLYGKMNPKEAIERMKKRLKIEGSDFNSSSPFKRLVPSHFKSKKKKNLVIFLQESLGYQFVSPEITPNLVALQKEAIWFDNTYSNGTRSVRGIAGVSSGFLSVPGKGVVKRNKSQSNFFTFANLLKPLGYHTMFIYGGEARFDNMRSWFLGNGFKEIIEQKDYKNPHFVANWGVSDEDLVDMANAKFNKLYKENKPFAALMFSSSNHSPFDIPNDRVKPIKPGIDCVENAVHYADFAIGKFFKMAKESPYYKDTVFVVVADHNVRVYGDDIVPVNMFHIPALILGGGIKSQTYSKATSQPDILATALDLLGRDFSYPILGKSIFSDEKADINLLQFNQNYALKVKEKVAVIVPKQESQTYIYKDKHLVKTKHDKELEKDAKAFVIGINWLYDKQKFKP